MKIKREDIGLYFALGLVGGGLGLLVGAFIASRRGGPTPGHIPMEERVPHPSELKGNVKTTKSMLKKSRKKKSAKKDKNELSPELVEFIALYGPSAIQVEMVKSKLLTLEALREIMRKEMLAKEAAPYNYSAPYLEDEKPDLADLAVLPEDEDVIDDRYEISQKPPKRKSAKNMRVIYYDQEDDAFYTMTRQKQPVPIGSIAEFVTEETWEVMLPYMISGLAPLYVNDLKTAKYYRFEIVPADMEESTGHDDVSYE